MQNSLLHVVWTEVCVATRCVKVCTQPPYNDKNPSSVFFITKNHKPFVRSSHSQIIGRVTSHRPRLLPRLLINTGVLSQTRAEWTVISPPLFRLWSRCRQERLLSDWGVLLLEVIMDISVLIYSRHLSCWRCSGLPLFVKGMRPRSAYMRLCSHESLVIPLHLQKKWVYSFIWIFANHLS